jgi:hypothetical protein
VVRSGEITLTVSTGVHSGAQSEETGVTASPALTAYLRQKLADAIGPEYSRLAALLGELRPQVKRKVAPEDRPQLWRKMIGSGAIELLRQQQDDEARQLLEDYVREASLDINKEANTTDEEHY